MSAPGSSATDRLHREAAATHALSRSLRVAGRVTALYAALAVFVSVVVVSYGSSAEFRFVDPAENAGGDALQISFAWQVWWFLSAILATVIASTMLLGAAVLDRLARLTAASLPPPPPPAGADHYR